MNNNKNKICLVRNCQNKSIASHSFSKFLYEEIKEKTNGKFIFFDYGKPYPKAEICEDAHKSYLLCNLHDNETLSPFEKYFAEELCKYRDESYGKNIKRIKFLKKNKNKYRRIMNDLSERKFISSEDQKFKLLDKFKKNSVYYTEFNFNKDYIFKFIVSSIWKHIHQDYPPLNLIIDQSTAEKMEGILFDNQPYGNMDAYISHIFFDERVHSLFQLSPKNATPNEISFYANGFRLTLVINSNIKCIENDEFMFFKKTNLKLKNLYYECAPESYEISELLKREDIISAIDRILT